MEKIDGFKIPSEEYLEELNKKIQQTPDKAELYSERGICRNFLLSISNIMDNNIIANVSDKNQACDKILADFQKAIDLNPDNLKYYKGKGDFQIEIFKYEDAIKTYSKAIEYFRVNHEAYFLRAKIYHFKLNKHKLALQDYNTAINKKPLNSEYHFYRSILYLLEINDTKKALQGINNAIELDPVNEEYYFLRALINKYFYNRQQKVNKDLKIIISLITLNPHIFFRQSGFKLTDIIIPKMLKLEICFGDMSKFIEQAIKISLNNNLVKLYQNKNKYLQVINKKIKSEPKKESYYFERALIYNIIFNEQDKAMQDINKAIELEPHSKYFILKASLLKNYYNQPENAIDIINKHYNINNSADNNYIWLAENYYFGLAEIDKNNLSIKTIDNIKKGINTSFNPFVTNFLLKRIEDFENISMQIIILKNQAFVFTNVININKTPIDFYNIMIKSHPNRPDLYIARGNEYLSNGKDNKAEADFKKALKFKLKEIQIINIHFGLARVYFKNANYEKVIKEYNCIMELMPNNSFFRLDLISLYLNELKNIKKADETIEHLKDINKGAYFTGKGLKYLYIKEDTQRAVAMFKKSIAWSGDHSIFAVIGFLECEKYELALEAINNYEKNSELKEIYFESDEILKFKVKIFLELKHYEKMLKVLKSYYYNTAYNAVDLSYYHLNKAIAELNLDRKKQVLKTLKKYNLFLVKDNIPDKMRNMNLIYINSEKELPVKLFISHKCDLVFMVKILKTIYGLHANSKLIKNVNTYAKEISEYYVNSKKVLSYDKFHQKKNHKYINSYLYYRKEIKKYKDNDEKIRLLLGKIEVLNCFQQLFMTNYKQFKKQYSDKDINTAFDLQNNIVSILLEEYRKRIKNKEEEVIKVRLEEKERANQKMQKMIQQYTHTLANTLFPNTIYEVSQKLKKHTKYKKDAMVLTDAYHSEIFMKHQGHLLAIRNTSTAKGFQSYIRGDRLEKNTKEKTVTVAKILDNAAERVLSRFFNEDYHKLDKIRKILCEKYNTTLEKWRDMFEKDVFYNEKSSIEWASKKFAKIETKIEGDWDKVILKKQKYAEALLQGYFSELFFNALKYRDHKANQWCKVTLSQEKYDNVDCLTAIWENPYVPEKNISISTHRGLESIKADLEMLNEKEPEKTVQIHSDENTFRVKLLLRRDLFILPPKKQINLKNIIKNGDDK